MPSVTDVVVHEGASLREVLEAITRSGRQIALVVDGDLRLVGVATDGDIRKALIRGVSLDSKVEEAMNRSPIVAAPGLSPAGAIALMRSRSIRHLPLVDGGRRVLDLLVLDDLLAPPRPLTACAVIMAGGQGRRLMPHTESTPKPLVTVGGRPLLEILIDRLRESGIAQILIAVHHLSEMIRDRLGDGRGLGVSIAYVEEPTPLGTMGALTLVRDRLREPFFVVNGDILTKCDFRTMWEFHRSQADVAITVGVSVQQVEMPYGEFTLRGNRVVELEEKPRKEFPVNAGIYVVEPSAVDAIPAGQYFDATDLIRLLLRRGRHVAAHLIREYWLDVGRPPDLEKANRDVAAGLLE